MTTERVRLCDAAAVAEAVGKMAEAIIGEFRPQGKGEFVLVGLYKQGVPLAERLIAAIEARCGYRAELGKLDISMYRDDVGLRSGLPLIRETVIPFDMEKQRVILVDDVLSSGRTIRAALDAMTDYGRPALIRLAVLFDRGQPEFPIRADYAGFSGKVGPAHKVVVAFKESDGEDAIWDVEMKQSSERQ